MKIKEVCKQTGLTERTIRYYVEERLIQPESTVRNGRVYKDYSKWNVELVCVLLFRSEAIGEFLYSQKNG